MNLFSKIFISLMLVVFSSNIYAAGSSAPCGYVEMTDSVDGEAYRGSIDYLINGDAGDREQVRLFKDRFPYVIDKNNNDICSEDLSYRLLYMLFGASIDSELSKELFFLFHEPDESTIALSKNANIGNTIKNIYQAFSLLLFSIFIVAVSWQTVRYVYVTQSTGNFMGNNAGGKKKAASVAIVSLVLILLMMPVGSLMLVQVIIFSLAVMGIKLANYFLSNFLYGIQMETSEVKLSDKTIYNQSMTDSSNYIGGRLCEVNTRQAIFNEGFVDGGPYEEGTSGFFKTLFSFFFGGDKYDSALNVAALCNSYTDSFYVNGDNVLTTLRSEIVHGFCDHQNLIPLFSRDINDPELKYGKNHSCLDVSFNFPVKDQIDVVMQSEEAQRVADFVYDQVTDMSPSDDEYYNNFSFRKLSQKIIDADLSSFLSRVLGDQEMSSDEKERLILDELNKRSFDFVRMLRSDDAYSRLILLENYDPSLFKNNAEMVNAVYIQNLAAMNNALGGYIVEDVDPDFESGFLFRNSLFSVNRYNRNIKKLSDDVAFSGVQEIRRMISDKAANNYMSANCALSIDKLSNSFQIFKKMEDGEKNPERKNDSGGNNFACLDIGYFGKTKSASASGYIFAGMLGGIYGLIVNYMAPDVSVASHIHYLQDLSVFESLVKNSDNFEDLMTVVGENQEVIKDYVNEKMIAADMDRYLLASYNYIIRKAFLSNMIKEMKDFTDHSVTKEVRFKGWAGLGSMMLEIATQQANAASMVNDAQATGSTYSPFQQTDAGISFVNPDAFSIDGGLIDGFVRNSNQASGDLVSITSLVMPMTVVNGLVLGGTESSSTYSSTSVDFNLLTKFIDWFLDFLFNTPFMYLKVGVGFDVEKSMVESVADCSKSIDCYPDKVHPVNGLLMFGQSLFNTVIWILLILVVVDFIASFDVIKTGKGDRVDSTDVKGGAASSGIFGFVTKIPVLGWIIKIIQVIAKIVSIVMAPFKPFFYLLLFAGVLIGFIMPTIPYMMTLIVVIGWYITIFVVSIAFPINLLLMSRIREDGEHELKLEFIWQKIGNVLIKPALITIGIIFAWVLVNVSIFYVNSTIFSLFSVSLGSSAGIMSKIATPIMVYFIFIMSLYFIIQHSFYIILKFSDDVAQALSLTQTGDQSMYSSLAIERLLAANAISDAARGTVEGGTAKVTGFVNERIVGMKLRASNLRGSNNPYDGAINRDGDKRSKVFKQRDDNKE